MFGSMLANSTCGVFHRSPPLSSGAVLAYTGKFYSQDTFFLMLVNNGNSSAFKITVTMELA